MSDFSPKTPRLSGGPDIHEQSIFSSVGDPALQVSNQAEVGFFGPDTRFILTEIGKVNLKDIISPHSANRVASVPPQLLSPQPSRWDRILFADVSVPELELLHQHIRAAKERYAAVPRSTGAYEVIYGAVATFSDGSFSAVSLNIPRITEVNRCAESGLVAHIEGQTAGGAEQKDIQRLTLVGLPLGDESPGFSTHPNPCARCRDRLQVLASLGALRSDTEILIVALNQDGSLPLGGRFTTYGDLLVPARESVPYRESGLVTRNRAATVVSVLEELQEHFGTIPLDARVLRPKIARALRDLQRGNDTTIVVGVSQEGDLEIATTRPSVVVVRGGAQKFSAETAGVVSALIEEWKNPFFVNVSTMRRPSSVTKQRYLDLVHHLHAKGEEERVRILQVSGVSSRRDTFSLNELDPLHELPLGEGPLHRGRHTLIEPGTGQIRFSSKLGVRREVVARLLAKVEIERLIPSPDGEGFVPARKSRIEKVLRVERVLGGSVEDALAPYPGVTELPHCSDVRAHGSEFGEDRTRRIGDRLRQMLDGAENIQKRTNPHGGARYPLVAVLGTQSGEPVARFEFVSPCPTGHEEHGVDPMLQALAELLHVAEPDRGPDALHLAWRGAEPLWGDEHEGLMGGVREVLGNGIRLIFHRDIT